MTPIPKSIANHNIKYLTFWQKYNWLVLLIIFILTLFRPNDFLVILVLCSISVYLTREIHHCTAHEVIDTGKGLLIKNHKTNAEIDYHDILDIDYRYYFFAFQNNAVKLTIKPHDGLGDTVYFISWADSCNYNREFRLNPMVKTPETLAWIEHINNKIKDNAHA